ncbi:MAG: ATP-dependent DNA helicase RecG [Planctomycetia bacterium]|nr:MAG: ATP-dependent DNA helicase RecG [Planctomycetia bacterium]
MQALRADTEIQFVRGVGPRRAEWFAKAGVRTVGDLLEYFPSRYEPAQGGVPIGELRPGAHAAVIGDVIRTRGRDGSLLVDISDGMDDLRLRWFQATRAAGLLKRGMRVCASGRVTVFGDRLEMVQPDTTVLSPDEPPPALAAGAKLIGVYPGNGLLKPALVRRTIETILVQPHVPTAAVLPAELVKRRGLLARDAALRAMHEPRNAEEQAQARRSLAYEELLLVELGMALRRRRLGETAAGQKLLCTPEIDRRIRARFPFPLTKAQDGALREIVRDLRSGRGMTRLLQGDVGSGKTVVALYACLLAVANRKQAAIMAPTEILAQQHFQSIEKYLAGSRVRRALLRGGAAGRRERGETLAAIERGEMDLLVGTQALIQKDVIFADLALVVVDEQHKFGVLQRHEFRGKGGRPHYLVMTATPIPRTLAMTVFGDLDVSLIRGSPPGRGRIVTRVTPGSRWTDVLKFARGRIEAGEQAYVVCPQIGEEEPKESHAADGEVAGASGPTEPRRRSGASRESDGGARAGARREVRTALEVWRELTEGAWKGLRVGLLHGGLKPEQTRRVLSEFSSGELQAIVCTTVVEVGIDVPAATLMIVDHAERYGLSQLHQLRGRVGRGSRDSLCVLVNRGQAAAIEGGTPAAERLAVLARTTNGFEIAEADLQLRGPGQLLGTRQHGLPELRVASLATDEELTEQAREDAFAIVAADPRLADPVHAALRSALRRMFAGRLALIDAA